MFNKISKATNKYNSASLNEVENLNNLMSILNTVSNPVKEDEKIRPFTPTITDINSYGFTINAEAFSNVGEIVSYTYILNGEIIQSSNDKKCIVSLLEANKRIYCNSNSNRQFRKF